MQADYFSAVRRKISSIASPVVEVNVTVPETQEGLLKEILLTLKDISLKLETQPVLTKYIVDDSLQNAFSTIKKEKDFIPTINTGGIKLSKNDTTKTSVEHDVDIESILNKMNEIKD